MVNIIICWSEYVDQHWPLFLCSFKWMLLKMGRLYHQTGYWMGINWSINGCGMAYFQTNPNSFDQPIFGWQYPIIFSGSHFLEHNILPLYNLAVTSPGNITELCKCQTKMICMIMHVCSPRFFWTCLISFTLDCIWVWLNDLGTDRFALIRTFLERVRYVEETWPGAPESFSNGGPIISYKYL